MFLNPEYHKAVDPTPADLAMEQFRQSFKSSRVYVFEGYMIYQNASLEEAQRIITEMKLPLSASVSGSLLTVKYVQEIAACNRIMAA